MFASLTDAFGLRNYSIDYYRYWAWFKADVRYEQVCSLRSPTTSSYGKDVSRYDIALDRRNSLASRLAILSKQLFQRARRQVLIPVVLWYVLLVALIFAARKACHSEAVASHRVQSLDECRGLIKSIVG